MRKQDKIIIWPGYFDSTKTRKNGRRMPRNLAIPSPKISEVKDAAETLRFNCEPVMDVAYPKTPWLKTGMILVGKKRSKDGTIREIAKQLLRLRNAPAAPTAK